MNAHLNKELLSCISTPASYHLAFIILNLEVKKECIINYIINTKWSIKISNHDQWQKKILFERQSYHVIEVDREAEIRRDADFQTFVQEIGLQNVPRVYLAQFTLTISVRYKNVIAPTLPSIRDKTQITTN